MQRNGPFVRTCVVIRAGELRYRGKGTLSRPWLPAAEQQRRRKRVFSQASFQSPLDLHGAFLCVIFLLAGNYTPERVSPSLFFFFFFQEISQYEDGRRRSLSAQEGSTVLLECPLPHSVPSALPRLKVRGERREESKGLFDASKHVWISVLVSAALFELGDLERCHSSGISYQISWRLQLVFEEE